MKTRDEQAEEYLKSNYGTSYKSENKSLARIVAYRAFRNGWDAALKSQWRDASVELPKDSQDVFFRYVDECGSPSFAKGCFWKGTNVDSIFISYGREIDLDQVTHWMPIPDLP